MSIRLYLLAVVSPLFHCQQGSFRSPTRGFTGLHGFYLPKDWQKLFSYLKTGFKRSPATVAFHLVQQARRRGLPLHDTLNPNASTCAPCTSYLNSTCRLPGTRWAPPRRLTAGGASRATQRHCAADQRVAGVRLAGRVPRDGGLCERCQALSAIPC
jgi:hypothetical protein